MKAKRRMIRLNLLANRALRASQGTAPTIIAQQTKTDSVADRPRAGVPDFRSLGLLLRLTGLVAIGALFAALIRVGWSDVAREFSQILSVATPILFLSLGALAVCAQWLTLQPIRVVVGLSTACVALLSWLIFRFVLTNQDTNTLQSVCIAVIVALMLWGFIALETRAKSPAFDVVRLQALQARIRPHFLFNSLNAVASMVRSEPRKAETALLDLADLYRALMKDNRELTLLSEEVLLATQYLSLEKMRLAERLRVKWFVDNMPRDALVPPLVLQPLLENAVYHGIEPSAQGGDVVVNIFSRGDQLNMVVSNPFLGANNTRRSRGNNMAVGNIRERLKLHFDVEGALQQTTRGNVYEVRVTIPYRRAKNRPVNN